MTDDRCPPLDEILDRLRTPGRSEEATERHVAGCARCREAEAWLAVVLDATADGPLEEPPEAVIRRAISIPDEHARTSRSRGWSLARLVLDTLAGPLPAGVRGTTTGPRRLLYESDEGDLDVEISASPADPSACRVTATVLAEEAPGEGTVDAILWEGDRRMARATADETGWIVLDEVPPGRYRLEILSTEVNRAIRVDSLDVSLEER